MGHTQTIALIDKLYNDYYNGYIVTTEFLAAMRRIDRETLLEPWRVEQRAIQLQFRRLEGERSK